MGYTSSKIKETSQPMAETQWKVGRLTSDVKEMTLSWIERKG